MKVPARRIWHVGRDRPTLNNLVIVRKACVKWMVTNPCVSTGAPDSVSTKKSLFHDCLGFAFPALTDRKQSALEGLVHKLHSLFPQSISSKIAPKLFLIFPFEVYTPFFEEMGISQRVNLGLDVTEDTEKPNEVYFLKVPLSNLPDRGSLIFTLLSTSAADSFCCYKISQSPQEAPGPSFQEQ